MRFDDVTPKRVFMSCTVLTALLCVIIRLSVPLLSLK